MDGDFDEKVCLNKDECLLSVIRRVYSYYNKVVQIMKTANFQLRTVIVCLYD